MVLAPGAAAALLAFGAFGLPVLQATGYTAAGLWSNFRFASWGLLFGLVAIVAAALLAPMCRPRRATALLLGAAGVALLRVLQLPLNRSMAQNSSAGPGFLLALACLVALVLAAGVAAWLATARRGRPGG
jgi:hypothetical protein